MAATMKVTPSMKKWLGRLSQDGFKFTTYQSRLIGTELWKKHGVYFFRGPTLTATINVRRPVGSMVERMVEAGLIEWEEENIVVERRRELRCLRSVLTAKARMIINQAS